VAADQRSALPNIPGVPWWGAVLLAVAATAIGFAVDAGSGNKELGIAFSICHAAGCVLAVVLVRQTGLFTAVVQPPLILFVAVPGAYFLFHGGQLTGVKDLLINCGYPLIERFPLMLFTSAAVLLIGLGRWYLAMSHGTKSQGPTKRETAVDANTAGKAVTGLLAAVTAKFAALTRRGATSERTRDQPEPAPRRRRATADARSRRDTADARSRRDPADARSKHRSDRPSRAARATDTTRAARKPVKRAAPTRSRHARTPETEIIEPVAERQRRSRSARASESSVPPAEPRRRTRSQSAREPRKQPPADRYSTYPHPERRRRLDDYEPPLPRAANGSAAGSSGTHHPISRVRYRGDDGDSGPEVGARRPRPQRAWDAESWEYDA
jgi:hypothetical protein